MTAIIGGMAADERMVPIYFRVRESLLKQVTDYRHKRQFPSMRQAIEALLRAGLKANPDRPAQK